MKATENDQAIAAAQQETRRSEEMAQATLDGLTSHIAILDGEGKIIAVNAAWRKFSELNPPVSTIIADGADYLSVCDNAAGECSDEAGTAAAGIRAVLAGETDVFSLEYPCHAPDELRWFSLRVTRFPGGGPVRAVVSHENITPRKLADLALQRRVEELAETTRILERRNAELDQFAYITSHDLKAPLRGIANLSRWIEEDLEGVITPEISGQLNMLRGRVHRMEAMIEGILQYARIDRTEVPCEEVDVRALLTETIDLLAPPPGMAISLASYLPIVSAPRLRLQQVFQNLLSNAIKHHDKPAGRICVDARSCGDWYEFSVTDDGPGIAPRFQERIWMIFQTLEARDKLESTGIGLALVKKIVESQNGSVSVESQEGRGATFKFTWPKTGGPVRGVTVAEKRSDCG